MPRVLVAVLWLLALSSAARSDTPPSRTVDNYDLLRQAHSNNPLLRSVSSRGASHPTQVALSCSKVCSVGKACGNTCILRDKTCHVGIGMRVRKIATPGDWKQLNATYMPTCEHSLT